MLPSLSSTSPPPKPHFSLIPYQVSPRLGGYLRLYFQAVISLPSSLYNNQYPFNSQVPFNSQHLVYLVLFLGTYEFPKKRVPVLQWDGIEEALIWN